MGSLVNVSACATWQEFKPVWEGERLALLCLSNGCFLSATKDGQLLSDCNTSSPGT